MENALVHHVGDVETLTKHITMVHKDRDLLGRLREGALRSAPQFTWNAAGLMQFQAYREVIAAKSSELL